MQLRPHHLLCIRKFTGHGYDAAFTAHMTALTTQLRNAPDTPVTLVSCADDLCAACPHCCGGCCDAAEKTAALDTAVLTHCGLKTGEKAAWAALAETAAKLILQTDAFPEICSCCQWFALCRQTEVI